MLSYDEDRVLYEGGVSEMDERQQWLLGELLIKKNIIFKYLSQES